jgi:hypothetical protein
VPNAIRTLHLVLRPVIYVVPKRIRNQIGAPDKKQPKRHGPPVTGTPENNGWQR